MFLINFIISWNEFLYPFVFAQREVIKPMIIAGLAQGAVK